MRQAKLHVISVLLPKSRSRLRPGRGTSAGPALAHRCEEAWGHGRPAGQRQEREKNGAGVPRGSGTGQEGRPCPRGPSLSHSASNGTFHLTAPASGRAGSSLRRAAGGWRPSRHAGWGGEAADGTEKTGMLPRGLKSTLLRGKTQEHPRPCQTRSLCPSLPDAARPRASPLHWVGTFPKPRCFLLVSFLSRHLELPPAGSCHPSGWEGPGRAPQGGGSLSMKLEQSHVQHRVLGWHIQRRHNYGYKGCHILKMTSNLFQQK